jgi:hypothetical protein
MTYMKSRDQSNIIVMILEKEWSPEIYAHKFNQTVCFVVLGIEFKASLLLYLLSN